ncbi:MAG: hypothetical protein WBP45_05580 [Daejeonella sp.]
MNKNPNGDRPKRSAWTKTRAGTSPNDLFDQKTERGQAQTIRVAKNPNGDRPKLFLRRQKHLHTATF